MLTSTLGLLGMLALAQSAFAAESVYGPFEDMGKIESASLEGAASKLESILGGFEDFELLGRSPFSGPDLTQEDESKRDGRGGLLILLTDRSLTEALVSVHPKYMLGALLRLGFYERADGGLQLTMLQPETHVRVICNDLEDEALYKELATAAALSAAKLRRAANLAFQLPAVRKHIGPLREPERLREAKKDMFMMVGPLTYFRKESQFPLLHSEALEDDPAAQLSRLADEAAAQLAGFEATEKDMSYRWSQDPEADMRWRQVARVEAPGQAILLGVTRPRTEALAAQIVGLKRRSNDDRSPGLDHLCAFPIEVLLYVDGDHVEIRSAREMFRMDYFFWDAGKGAFMKYAKMPAMLDRSLKRALLGK